MSSEGRSALITGATGDTGRAAAREAVESGLAVRAMVHGVDARSEALGKLGAEIVVGDLLEIDTIFDAMRGIDAAYLVWPVQPGLIHATVDGRHAPIAADDQGRAIAARLKDPEGHAGTTINLSGPVEMDHQQMAAELSEGLGRTIVFRDIPIDEYCASIEAMGVPPYIVQHLRFAMDDYKHGAMSGADDNVERLTGRRPMTVGEFGRAHAEVLNG